VDLVPSQILTADFLADGRRVAFGVHGSVRIWDTDANTVMVLKSPPIHPHMIAASPDGSMVAAASHDSIVRLSCCRISVRIVKIGPDISCPPEYMP